MSNQIPLTAQINKGGSFRLRQIAQKWPALVWFSAVAFLIVLYAQRGTYQRINGMVAATIEEVAPPDDSIILTVHVKAGDSVKKGQTLVTLDPTLIQKEIDDFKANLPIEKIELQRKFIAARTSINSDLLRTKAGRAQAQARLALAERTVTTLRDRVERKLALESDLFAAEGDRDALRAETAALDEAIVGLEVDLAATKALVDEFNNLEIPGELLVLNQRLADKILIATSDGTVQKVYKMRGVAQLGDPILSLLITDDAPKTAIGFIPHKENPEELQVGATIWISERIASAAASPARIISVAPDLTALPNYGTPVPGKFLRGREFTCELPAELSHLLPGTGIHIHRKEPGKFNLWSFGKTPVTSASK